MKIFKKIAFVVVLLLLIYFTGGIYFSEKFNIRSSITINAPEETIEKNIKTNKIFSKWTQIPSERCLSSTGYYTERSGNGLIVTWTDDGGCGDGTFDKWMTCLIGLRIESDFKSGLDQLKQISEANPAPAD